MSLLALFGILPVFGLFVLFLMAAKKFFSNRNAQEKSWEKEQADFDAEYPANFGLSD